MTTATVLTLFLAKAYGIYFLAAGLTGLLSKDRWAKVLDDLRASPALVYICGIFTFALGVALIHAHNIWLDPFAALISLFGWAAAAEGLILIVYPGPLLNLPTSIVRPQAVLAYSLIVLVLGAVLLLLGLTGRAGIA